MSKIGKIFLWTLIISVLSVLIYFGLKQEKVFGFSFGPSFSFLKEHVLSLPKDYDQDFVSFRNSISEKGKETVSSLKNLFNKETDGFKNEVDKSKSSIFNIVEESLNKTENMAGKILGVESDSAADGSDLLIGSISYLAKINAPLSFVIKNPYAAEPSGFSLFNQTEPKDIKYKIDWGNEKQAEGKLKGGQSIIVSHSWTREGEYLVWFEITEANSKIFNSQIKILVVK